AGLTEYIGSTGLTVVEWPERLGSLRPAERLEIRLEAAGETARRCALEAVGKEWIERLEANSATLIATL
ncbi:hypothetical protein VU07_01125, partial [Desulfobulbus sp. F4]|nr:hypothetical protein [Desulfobulbus sp. F4]